jgi:type IV pilus assembly protein PilV
MAAEHRTRARRPAHGIALIEVMISLLIFLIGVLGIVGLQAKAVQFSVQSEDRSRAALLANELVAQMWDQQSSSLSSDKLSDWKTRVAAQLPQGTGTVDTSKGVVTVTLSWSSPRTSKTDAASNQYVTRVALP